MQILMDNFLFCTFSLKNKCTRFPIAKLCKLAHLKGKVCDSNILKLSSNYRIVHKWWWTWRENDCQLFHISCLIGKFHQISTSKHRQINSHLNAVRIWNRMWFILWNNFDIHINIQTIPGNLFSTAFQSPIDIFQPFDFDKYHFVVIIIYRRTYTNISVHLTECNLTNRFGVMEIV